MHESTIDIDAQIQAEHRTTVEIYDILLDEATLRYNDGVSDIVFDGQTYFSESLKRSDAPSQLYNFTNLTITAQNIDSVKSAMVRATDFIGRKIIIRRVFLSHLDDENNFIPIFTGKINAINWNRQEINFDVDQFFFSIFSKSFGNKISTRCRHTPGDEFCAYFLSGYPYIEDCPRDAYSCAFIYQNAQNFGGVSHKQRLKIPRS